MSSWHIEQGLWIVLKGVVPNSADWEWISSAILLDKRL